METLLINIEPGEKSKALKSFLASLDFISKVETIKNKNALKAAIEEHEDVKAAMLKRKNKAIAKYL